MPAEARTQTEAKVHPGRASRRGIVEPVVVGERMPTFATGYGHRDFWVRRLLATADVLAIFLALVISAPFSRLTPVVDYLLWGVLTIPVWIVLLKTYGLYDRDAKRVSHGTVDDLPWVFHAVVVGTLLMWLYYKFVVGIHLPLAQSVALAAGCMCTILILRSGVRGAASRFLPGERVALMGEDAMTGLLVRKMRAHPEYGLDPIGVLSYAGNGHSSTVPILGALADLPRVVRDNRIDRIVVSPTGLRAEDQIELLRSSRELSLKVSLLPHVFDAMGPSVEVDDVEGVTLLGMNPPVLARSSRMLKRALDVVGSAVLLILFAPLMILTALAIKLDSRGPVLFGQDRIGRHGDPFRLLKFRTMCRDAEDRTAELERFSKDPDWLHLEHDPRLTRIGRLLRPFSLDELPQLWNVLRGKMSLVGPRPLIESENSRVDDWAKSRLYLTPGLTGLWQVLGRTNIPFEEMVKLDYLYVANWSLWSDLRLILRTLPAVAMRRGAN